MALEDYKDLVGSAASICTIGQFFAGAFICKDIYDRGSTKNISVIPFLGGMAIGACMMIYSLILQDEAMTQVNVVGMVINVAYVACYYYYCDDRPAFHSQSIKAGAFVLAMVAYVLWEDRAELEFRYGIIITLILLLLIGSPLFSLGEIMRTRSTETLPFPMILSGTVVSSLWLLYGVIIKNPFVQFQNVMGLILNILQLSLFAIYPSKSEKSQKAKQ